MLQGPCRDYNIGLKYPYLINRLGATFGTFRLRVKGFLESDCGVLGGHIRGT